MVGSTAGNLNVLSAFRRNTIQHQVGGHIMDLLNNALGIHDKALRVRNQRMELLSRNIAN
jgi:hypothetical protein